MRALLVVNPTATATTARTRDILARALASDLKLEIVETTHRGHATALARGARTDGFDVVVSLGGDGTVNEIVNGLLTDGPGQLPTLAVVPSGGGNVFARALGMPRDPVDATSVILDGLRVGRRREVSLGNVSTSSGVRWFTFCAGFGLDAQVVRDVEKRRELGERSTGMLYVRSAMRQFYSHTDRRHPAITLERPGIDPVSGVFVGIVSNTNPWTYLGALPVEPTPAASFESGLDLFAVRSLGSLATMRTIRRLLNSRGRPMTGRSVLTLHDQAMFTLQASRPLAVQADGDFLGEHLRLEFRSVPRALTVVG